MELSARIYSIFPSIDGEVNGYGQGALTVFIRFAGCNLRCQYPCDTPNSLSGASGSLITIDQIINRVMIWPIMKISITGGEPLLQMPALLALTERLKGLGYYISVETNGSILPGDLPKYVDSLVVDYKLPSSGEEAKMKLDIFRGLTPQDYCKFVIADRSDFDRAVEIYFLLRKCLMKSAFSPVWGKMDPVLLIRWMMDAGLSMCLVNLQLHKIIQLSEPQ